MHLIFPFDAIPFRSLPPLQLFKMFPRNRQIHHRRRRLNGRIRNNNHNLGGSRQLIDKRAKRTSS